MSLAAKGFLLRNFLLVVGMLRVEFRLASGPGLCSNHAEPPRPSAEGAKGAQILEFDKPKCRKGVLRDAETHRS